MTKNRENQDNTQSNHRQQAPGNNRQGQEAQGQGKNQQQGKSGQEPGSQRQGSGRDQQR
ncbi:hypothetical protein [Novilysobacter spongiicola]|uniref:Uncharacterized protein n=1 Tax=Lysobacter spongiicola DSM 21749 TaxID=1122188 RepID=A0A1T4SCR1_9GAMM|nr:hypothetical protein [Lysobacter spongiicola]SKA26054.1 hypothetical protein SAMN02745674_02750 [Lysobacter spongiicola DSM 21749]